MIDVTARIAELMRVKNWTAYKLSEKTEISTNAIYDWFKAGATPTLANIVRICDALDITLEFFFCGGREYTDEERRVLDKWVSLSEFEKNAVKSLIDAFTLAKYDD